MTDGGYKIRNKEGIYFVTFAVVEWVDVFTRPDYFNLLVESLKYCQKEKGLIIYAWCLMSNHVHLIVEAQNQDLSEILRDFKKFTSKELIKSIKENRKESRKDWMLNIFQKAGKANSRNSSFQFWRQDNHPIELFSNSFLGQKLEYLHQNPVVNGIVDNAADYRYSSARSYEGISGMIDVSFLD